MALPCLPILAQTPITSDHVAVLLFAVLVLAMGFGAWAYTEKKKVQAGLEARVRQLLMERQAPQPDNPRDQVLFDQHKRMNDLQIAKLTAEVELLQRQVKARSFEEDRMEAGKEYHELMVEKTRLEMDNLRLHIAEMRKRMEDWRSDMD